MRIGAVMEPWLHAPMVHASWAGSLGVDPFLRVNIEGVRYGRDLFDLSTTSHNAAVNQRLPNSCCRCAY